MKLILVEYVEESSKAIFFNVTIETKSFLGKVKRDTKRALLEKWSMPGFKYANNFIWSDNTESHFFDDAIINEMILKYENRANEKIQNQI